MEERIDEVVKKNLVNIVKIEITVEDALREVKLRAKGLLVFANKYLGAQPKVSARQLQKTNSGLC